MSVVLTTKIDYDLNESLHMIMTTVAMVIYLAMRIVSMVIMIIDSVRYG